MKNIFKFRVHTIRTLRSPYVSTDKTNNESYEVLYYLLVNMKDLPSKLPLDVNPRQPKMTTNVAKQIKNAVLDTERDFYINNRGIVISAKSFKYNTTDSTVMIDLGDTDNEDDKFTYGILDGGHTYTAIMECRDEIKDMDKYVRIEVITNVQNITRLSDARNKSVQVSDIALFNLENQFDPIREAIKNESYADKIAYKDNEDKEINISELLRIIFAFDIDRFPDDTNAPIQAYSGKAQVFKQFKESCKTTLYKFLISELPLLVKLYDKIQLELGDKYNEFKHRAGANAKFGAVRGVESNDSASFTTTYFQKPTKYNISIGYIYPILGAFRALLAKDEVTNTYYWSVDPIEMWDEIGVNIVQNVFESNNKNNPQLAGKDKTLWLGNYRIVDTQKFKIERDKLLKQLAKHNK